MRFPSALVVIAAATAFLSGCLTGDVARRIPIAGGDYINVPLSGAGPKPGSGGGYTVGVAALQPGKEAREAFYSFALLANHEPDLRHIRIVDMSDEKPATLLEQDNPVFENRLWKADSETLTADDPRLQWVFQIPLSMRVYRFTLTRKDGSEVTFDHVGVYPPMIKELMRNRWGEKY